MKQGRSNLAHNNTNNMKTFRELQIAVDVANTEKFVAAVDMALTGGWTRKKATEDPVGGWHVYYVCDAQGERPKALLAIYRKDDHLLYVSNIVPAETSELTHDQYNLVLMAFHDNILRKLATDFSVTILATGDQRKIEDLLSADAFKALKTFSTLANRSTGSAHPMDRDRWYAFLIAVHQEKSPLDTTDLMRWLTEVEKWPERVAHDLVIEFEFAKGLLDAMTKTEPSN